MAVFERRFNIDFITIPLKRNHVAALDISVTAETAAPSPT